MTRVVALLLLLILVVAPIVTATNVPDLTWLVGGVYDGADADEILTLVWDQTPAISVEPARVHPSTSAPCEVVAPAPIACSPAAPSSVSRAPPIV